MARSRKSADAALGAALAAPDSGPGGPVAIAYSGGLDSTVLLNAAVRRLGAGHLLALHVHHGLQPAADGWVDHCSAACARLGVRFRVLYAAGSPARGDSLEAWARERRYALLLSAARAAGAVALLTAHHADDQLETVLLQLARGAGPDGLAGIAARHRRDGVLLLRPLLGLDRAALLADAREHGLQWVEDPTNADPDRPRNAIRLRLAPVLHEVLPTLRDGLPATLALLADACETLAERARTDLADAQVDCDRWSSNDDPAAPGSAADAGERLPPDTARLDRQVLAALPPARQRYALRAWLAALGAPAAPHNRLEAMRAQLVEGGNVRGEVSHAGWCLVRQGDRLHAWRVADLRLAPAEAVVTWRGEPEIDLPGGDRIRFVPAPDGVSADWLRDRPLHTGVPATSARLRPVAGRSARTLKNLWQEAGVPVRLRTAFPALRVEGRLLWAAPFGMDRGPDWPRGGQCVVVAWRPAGPGDPRRWWPARPDRAPTL